MALLRQSDVVRAGQVLDALVRPANFWHKIIMKSITGTRKPRGRPRVGSTSVNVRLTPSQLAALDDYIAKIKDRLNRPEAIRRLVEQGLKKR